MAIYGNYLLGLVQNSLANKSWKAALVVANYAQSIDTESKWSAVQPYEVTGAGYVAGGQSVSLSAQYFSSINTVAITVGSTIDFGVVTIADIGGVVIYDWTGTASTSSVLLVDPIGPVAVDGAQFTYTAPSTGLLRFAIL